jgi:di-heme oxidoreductase (putative peroxidase)
LFWISGVRNFRLGLSDARHGERNRGDLTTITEAILRHAGEARPQRERFAALSNAQQKEIVEFLKQLQVLPNGAPHEINDRDLKRLLREQRNAGIH